MHKVFFYKVKFIEPFFARSRRNGTQIPTQQYHLVKSLDLQQSEKAQTPAKSDYLDITL